MAGHDGFCLGVSGGAEGLESLGLELELQKGGKASQEELGEPHISFIHKAFSLQRDVGTDNSLR